MATDIENVIIIVADALRRDRVGVYDSERDLTPFLDEWVTGGDVTVFDQAYSCSTATDPSVTSIHTGQFPLSTVYHHSKYVTDAEKHRAEAATTLPGMLRSAGWNTIATGGPLGRWHYSDFDEYPVPSVSRRRSSKIFRLIEQLNLTARQQFDRLVSNENTGPISESVNKIKAGNGPTYCFIRLMDTHIPYEPPTELVDDLLEQFEYPHWPISEFINEYGDRPYISDVLVEQIDQNWETYGIERLIAQYDAAVIRVDQQIKQLITKLQDRELYDSTAIVFTSDHGESLTEHEIFFDHHGLYDETVRVPLFVRVPGLKTPEQKTGIVQLPDIFPTIAELVNVEYPESLFGQSFLPRVAEDSQEWRPREIAASIEAYAHSRIMARTEEWKYIEHRPDPVLENQFGDSLKCRQCDAIHRGGYELYDIDNDPDENINVVDDHPETVSEFQRQLYSNISDPRIEEATHREVSGESIEYTHEKELIDQLEDLGYR